MVNDDLWDIAGRQQTEIKLDILRKYLRAWAIIVGEHFPKAYFVDCFCGRGKYHKGSEQDSVFGSPLIALAVADEVKKIKAKKGRQFDLSVIAVDSDGRNIADLKRFAADYAKNGETPLETMESEFESAMPGVIKKISGSPAFFFIDPYGIKGVTKKALDLMVNRTESTEIFLNYMKMGVQRVAGQHKNVGHENETIRIMASKTVKHLDDFFGGASWIGKADKELLRHFVDQVFRKNYKFVLNFDVPYPDRKGTIYNLVFATNYSVAEKIMKDIMTQKLFKGTLFEDKPFQVEWRI